VKILPACFLPDFLQKSGRDPFVTLLLNILDARLNDAKVHFGRIHFYRKEYCALKLVLKPAGAGGRLLLILLLSQALPCSFSRISLSQSISCNKDWRALQKLLTLTS
jgi:hypothetical protein